MLLLLRSKKNSGVSGHEKCIKKIIFSKAPTGKKGRRDGSTLAPKKELKREKKEEEKTR